MSDWTRSDRMTRQEWQTLKAQDFERLEGQIAELRSMLRLRRHNGEVWSVGFARDNWPRVAEILEVPEIAAAEGAMSEGR